HPAHASRRVAAALRGGTGHGTARRAGSPGQEWHIRLFHLWSAQGLRAARGTPHEALATGSIARGQGERPCGRLLAKTSHTAFIILICFQSYDRIILLPLSYLWFNPANLSGKVHKQMPFVFPDLNYSDQAQ